MFMRQALELAVHAQSQNEVPVGAVVVRQGDVIGRGFNQTIHANDPSAHAEVVAVRDAAQRIGNHRLVRCSVYVSVEPCLMCVGLLVHARIQRLIFGSSEPKAGAITSRLAVRDMDFLNHEFEITAGVLATESQKILQRFFRAKRSSH